MFVFFALLPILALIVALLIIKLPIRHAAGISLISAVIAGMWIYQVSLTGILISSGKGLALALFVLMIIWSAIFLYNLVSEAGSIRVIDRNISIFIKSPFEQFLLLTWLLAPFMQGVAGYGVPVIAVLPILLSLGFEPVKATAAILLGHSWSICLGSMGAPFYALEFVTNLPTRDLAVSMGIFVSVALFCTGVVTCAFYDGIKQVKSGLIYLIPVTCTMSICLYLLADAEALSFLGMATALTGMITMLAIYFIRMGKSEKIVLYSDSLKLSEAILPYALIFGLSILFHILNLKPGFGFSFPGYVTGLDFIVAPVENYSKILYFKHPSFIILFSFLIAALLYTKKGVVDGPILKDVVKKTIKKCSSTTITLAFLLPMALIMTDSGMTAKLSEATVAFSGAFYPVFSPFIGLLGNFITASSTNSNVIFGGFQESVALQLSMSAAVMCGVQAVGASIGAAIGPTTVLMGTAAAKLSGQERLIYKKNMLPTLMITLVLGIANLIIIGYF